MSGTEMASVIPCLNTKTEQKQKQEGCVHRHVHPWTAVYSPVTSPPNAAQRAAEEGETAIGTNKLCLYNTELMTYHHILHRL